MKPDTLTVDDLARRANTSTETMAFVVREEVERGRVEEIAPGRYALSPQLDRGLRRALAELSAPTETE